MDARLRAISAHSKFFWCVTIVYSLLLNEDAVAHDMPVDPDVGRHAALRQKLLSPDYDRFALPSGRNQSLPVGVQFGLSLQGFAMNEPKMTVDMQVWYRVLWNDLRLVWDPQDHGGIKVLRLPATDIWIPDVASYNDHRNEHAESSLQSLVGSMALVYSKGSVLYVPKARMSAHCPFDYTLWPFDQHVCTLEFGSWTHNGFDIDLQPYLDGKVDTSDFSKKGGWELEILGDFQRKVTYYVCCPEPYVSLTVKIRFARVAGHHQYTLLTPLHLIVLLTLVSLWMPTSFRVYIALGNAFLPIVLLQFHFTQMSSMVERAPLIASFASSVLLLQVATLVWTFASQCITRSLSKISTVKRLVKTARRGILGVMCCLGSADKSANQGRHAILGTPAEEHDDDAAQQQQYQEHSNTQTWHSETEIAKDVIEDNAFLGRFLTFLMSCGYCFCVIGFYSAFWPMRGSNVMIIH